MRSSTSRATQGGFQFLKLCTYYHTWEEEWEFVLEFLHLKLKEWLEYLESTMHMDNLWVEREDSQTFKLHDTSPGDGDYISKKYPHYTLSDSAVVWIALLQLEKLIGMIEERARPLTQPNADRRESMAKDVRQWYDSHQDNLNVHKVRKNILKTYQVSRDEASPGSTSHAKASVGPTVVNPDDSQSTPFGALDSLSMPLGQRASVGNSIRAVPASGQAKPIIILQRKIDEYTLETESTDFAIIEAAIMGIFESSQGQVQSAWRATLNVQKYRDVETFEEPRHVSLTLFASRFKYDLARAYGGKFEEISLRRLRAALYDSGFFAQKIEEDKPGMMRSWSAITYETISLLIGSLLEPCREVL